MAVKCKESTFPFLPVVNGEENVKLNQVLILSTIISLSRFQDIILWCASKGSKVDAFCP